MRRWPPRARSRSRSTHRPSAPLFATLAVLMAASRVYLAVHHVSDVVVGLAVGACTGAAFALLAG